MRVLAILLGSLLVFGALAGCVGGDKKGAEIDPLADDGDTPAVPGTGGSTQPLRVLAALATTLTLDAPAWVASGTEVPVKLSEPANAKGNVTYSWAIGPRPGTVEVTPVIMDTGSKPDGFIQPGASKSLTYATAGVYMMHCHPHPFMLHNVTVIEGYDGPAAVDVFITDGAKPEESRFIPENIVVGTNTVVTYKNVGAQPHTATAMGAQEPPLAALPLDAAEGTVKVEGDGWLRIVAITTDDEGRLGVATENIYVTPELPAFETQTLSFDFTHGTPAPAGGTPAQAAPKSAPLSLELPGKVTLTYAFKDAVGGTAGQNLAQVEIHFTKDGETQDTITAGPDPEDVAEGKAIAGAYTLKVVPLQGAQVSGTITVDVVYDLVPPEPEMAEAPADDGHGGHAH